MSSWHTVTLEEMTPPNTKYGIVDGPFGSNLKTIHYKSSGIPIITSGFVTEGVFHADKYLYVTKEKYEAEKRSSVSGGDIVMAKIGARCGASAILPYDHETGILSGNALKISIDKNRYSAKLVWQILWMLYKNGSLEKLKTVGAQPAISMSSLKKLKLTLPDLNEQERVVAILDDWDVYIEKLDKKLEVSLKIQRGLMQQLLSGRTRLHGFRDNWKVVDLGSISQIKTGKKDNQNKVSNGAYPFFVRSPNIERIDSYSYDGEAILVPGEGNIGKIFHYINGRFDFHQRVYKISDFDKSVSGKYIHYYFMQNFAREVSSGSVKATVDSLRLPTFTNFKINLPPREEQDAIVTILNTVSKDIDLLKRKRLLLSKQKDYLANNLISGKIRTPEDLTVMNLEAQHA